MTRGTLDAEDVLARAAEWVWVPAEARELRTPEFWLVAYPAHFSEPTMAMHLTTTRSPEALVDDVLEAASAFDRTSVAFAGLSSATEPPTLEPLLAERGELAETLAVLARPLVELPDLDVPDDIEVRQVLDLQTRRDEDHVSTTVFGGGLMDDEQLAESLERVLAQPLDPHWVAYRAGVPVGAAGMAIASDVARLWGGSVLPEARGTGAYRALLDQRLRTGRDSGCRMALVKGRVATSAPILRRAGFTAYGEERAYRVTAG